MAVCGGVSVFDDDDAMREFTRDAPRGPLFDVPSREKGNQINSFSARFPSSVVFERMPSSEFS